MEFKAKVNAAQLKATVEFLMELLEGGGAEHGLVVDQDAARLAIAVCLDLKDPKSPMKDEMYNAFTPHATNLAVEGVSFRTNREHGKIEVLLQPRPHDDLRYRGQVACPGQGIRPSDSGPQTALARLTAMEFKVPTRYEFVDDVYVTNGLRGWYECKVYLAFSCGEPPTGEWHPADPLPVDTDEFKVVASHRRSIIPSALDAYKKMMREREKKDLGLVP